MRAACVGRARLPQLEHHLLPNAARSQNGEARRQAILASGCRTTSHRARYRRLTAGARLKTFCGGLLLTDMKMQVADLYQRCLRVLWKHFGKQATRERISLHLVARPTGERGWSILVHSSWWTPAGNAWRWSKTASTAEELLESLEQYAVPIARSCLAFESASANGDNMSLLSRATHDPPPGAQTRSLRAGPYSRFTGLPKNSGGVGF